MSKRDEMDKKPEPAIEMLVELPPARVQSLSAWAFELGHLPAELPGNALHPTLTNRNSWRVQAICLGGKLTMESLIDEATYNTAFAMVGEAQAR
jgi:hypothetical protein